MSRSSPGDDADIVHRALGGDQKAFAELIARHREAVFRFARHYTGDIEEALDLTQDSFVGAYLALNRYDPVRPFRPWLMRIAVNKCHDWSRRRKVRAFFSAALPLEAAAGIADDAAAPDNAVGGEIELARVSVLISELSAPLREVLILRTIEDLTQSEVSYALGISEKAVETRLYRARRQLAAHLSA